jgi:PEP-CTERM motif
MHALKYAALAVALGAGSAAWATPAAMVEAKGCAIIAGGVGFGTCTETHNQAGLAIGYVDEATPLHAYVGLPPLHTEIFSGFEWFSDSGTTSAAVSYFVSASPRIRGIDHFVLWNEESSGIGVFNLYYGAFAGDLADLVLAGISPIDNGGPAPYAPEFWEFSPRPNTGWWTLVMDRCPQPIVGSFPACAVGEVAWGGPAIPEPATWAMMIAGFGLVGWAMRRRTAIESVSA